MMEELRSIWRIEKVALQFDETHNASSKLSNDIIQRHEINEIKLN